MYSRRQLKVPVLFPANTNMASKVVAIHEFGEFILDFVITEAVQRLGQWRRLGRSGSCRAVLPSDVFIMLPVTGNKERKLVLYFTSIRLSQIAAS